MFEVKCHISVSVPTVWRPRGSPSFASMDESPIPRGFCCLSCFWRQLIIEEQNWKSKSLEAAHPASSLCGVRQTLPVEEGGGDDRVSCNYIYVGSHSICHSKFCLTCHIVNHYSGLDAGYELKRPGKESSPCPCDCCICLFLTG